MEYTKRYSQLLSSQGVKNIISGSVLFREYHGIIIPLGKIEQKEDAYNNFVTRDLKSLKGKLIWWAYKTEKKSGWYGVIKRNYTPIANYKSSNIRNQIKKGLNNNEVKKINANYLISNGYTVYSSALKRFTPQNKIITPSDYEKLIKPFLGFEDLIDVWGIFQEKTFVGYSIVYKYGKEEANISEVRIKPDANKFYPSYALFHVLQEYYLQNKEYSYISDGYRNISHNTKIQQMLIEKFGFEKTYLHLKLYIRQPYKFVVKLLYPFKKIIRISKLSSLFRLLDYAKN